MISETVRQFMEKAGLAYVASADEAGFPHLAAGRDLQVPDSRHVAFEAWFCHVTLHNVAHNPRVAIAVTDPATGDGYQLLGVVEQAEDVAILDGFAPGLEEPGMPQFETRLVVRVEQVMAFSAGVHSDRPLGE